jgi:hypothetical protein
MRFLLPAIALVLAAGPAQAAERSFTVTGFTKIRIDGAYKVKVTTNSAPFARASGDPSGLDQVAMDVEGSTLVIHPDRSSWGGYPGQARKPVEITLGTHDLASAWVNGPGTITIDRVRGLTFDFAIEGSGSGSIASVDVDQMRIQVAGTATATVAGKAPRLTARVRGASSLDASGLASKDVVVAAEGPASVKIAATYTAKVDAYGTSVVDLTGRPACTSRIYGSATVNGCK